MLTDIQFSLRTLFKSRGFAALAISMLAVGIGINTAVFTITNAVLFRGFPHVDPNNRILYIDSPRNGLGGEVSYPDFEDWRTQARSFSGMAVVSNGGLRLILDDRSGVTETCDGTELSANSFEVLRQKPILGRDFETADEAPGAPAVAILTYSFWQRRYAKDPSLVGRTIRLNGTPTTVIGIMPPGFDFPHHRVDLWVPLASGPNLQRRDSRVLWFAFGRLMDGVSIRSAQAEMDTIGHSLESAYQLTNQGVRPLLLTFHEEFIGHHAAALYTAIWGAVGFVLLISCANLANLLLARAIGRSREIAVRIALGAGRARIIRQLLVESVMLSSLGGVFGWLVAIASVRAYEVLSNPPSSYNNWDYALDVRVFAYLVAISILTGLVFGLVPALRLTKIDINTALKDGRPGMRGGVGRRGLSALVVSGEMALAIVLLAGAGLMLRSFLNIYTADLGVRAGNLLSVGVRLPVDRYPDAQAEIAFFERLSGRLKSVPGVNSTALAGSLPGLYAPRLSYELAGAPPIEEQGRPTVSTVVIGPDYFRTVGAAVLAGREFNDFDRPSATPVVIVNQRFVRAHWQAGEDPLGKRLRLFDGKAPDAWRIVAGVVSNIVQKDNTGQSLNPVVYVPFRQRPAAGMDVLAQTRVPPGTLERSFRHEIQALDPELVIYSGLGSVEGPKPLTESLALNNYWSRGVNATLFLVFAALAVLLAAFGLYAVIAHTVSQRTSEIGIRMAVGARASDIFRLVLVQGISPVTGGLALGLGAAVGLTRFLKSELVQVSPADPVTLGIASAVLVLSSLLGCWIPVRRAMRVDPVVALRHE
ncbi:MAG TPA: ABC transporter permease [Vicinamibacterales bacterium]|nr:ABC transporter permease [Vicinamibacterales bacterium]